MMTVTGLHTSMLVILSSFSWAGAPKASPLKIKIRIKGVKYDISRLEALQSDEYMK